MGATVLNGRRIAEKIKISVKRDIADIKKRRTITPKLATLQIGSHSSSRIYLNAQIRLAGELGIKYHLRTLPAKTSQRKAERETELLNKDKTVAGIIVHTPVPKHINLAQLLSKIKPEKDVEGLNPVNLGKLIHEDWIAAPCTASACLTLIDSTGVKLRGKEAVIVGHSEIVGKPLSLMLLSRMATTTVCHIGTYEKGLLREHVQRAEVLIVSVGKSRLIKGSWIRKGAIVIDVGINRSKGVITGDVDFRNAVKKASFITPVPGGVGPVTAVMLMRNLVALYKKNEGAKR
jgi:methylenetetrahydrofolate dehydrogenase (NADP+)/methenyltetrahydrofolate cyclohydrolase